MKKIKTKQLVQTALLLAICLMSQYFRQMGQHFTGTIVNAAMILAVLTVGRSGGLLIGMLSPFTSLLLSPSPIISALPPLLPVIILGNCLLVVCLHGALTVGSPNKKENKIAPPGPRRLLLGLGLASILKSGFLTGCMLGIILPLWGGKLPAPMAAAAKIAFSVTQLITAMSGSLLVLLIWPALRKYWRQRG